MIKEAFRRATPGFIKRNYAVKFGIVILFIGLLFGTVGVGATNTMAGQVEQSVDRDFESTATANAQALDNWLETNAIELKSLARNEPFEPNSEMSDSEINTYLSAYRMDVADRSTLTLVHIVDPNTNTVKYSSRTSFQGERFSAEEVGWAREPDFEISGVGVSELYDTQDGYKAIAFMHELDDGRLLVTVHDVEDLGTEIFTGGANTDLTDAYTMVVDSRNTIVMSDATQAQTAPSVGETYPAESPALSAVRELEARTVSESMRTSPEYIPNSAPGPSSEYLIGYAPSGERVSSDFGSDWVVLVHAPSEQAYGLISEIQQGVYLFIGAALVGVLIVGGIFGRNTAAAISRLSVKSRAIEQGDFDVEIESGRTDEIGRLSDSIATMRDSLLQKIEDAEAAKETAEAARQRAESAQDDAEQARRQAEELAEQLQARAADYSDVMEACAAGDLSRRMDEDSENEAMRSIAESFNTMLDQWESTIVGIQAFADDVNEQSEEASQRIQEIRQASEAVAESTSDIDDAAKEQQHHITDVSDEMAQLSATIEEVAATADTVAENAQETAKAGDEGQTAASEALEELEAIQRQSQVAVEAIEELNDGMTQIGEIVAFITDLAEQTNMLALNANIEAARAGTNGNGEGFSVVASEVKSLAEETRAAVDEIEDVIDDVQATTDRAVDDIRGMRESVEDGSQTVEQALSAFGDIAERAEETNAGVQEIKSATDDQSQSAQEVAGMADRVADITDSTVDDIERVVTSTQEQSESITDVVENVETLSRQASDLREELDAFSVDPDDSPDERAE